MGTVTAIGAEAAARCAAKHAEASHRRGARTERTLVGPVDFRRYEHLGITAMSWRSVGRAPVA